MIFFPEYLPCRKLDSYKLPDNVEGMLIEMTVRNTKWLIVSGYNPRKVNINYFLSHVSKGIDMVLADYEHFLILGDFNAQVDEIHIKKFCDLYDLENGHLKGARADFVLIMSITMGSLKRNQSLSIIVLYIDIYFCFY